MTFFTQWKPGTVNHTVSYTVRNSQWCLLPILSLSSSVLVFPPFFLLLFFSVLFCSLLFSRVCWSARWGRTAMIAVRRSSPVGSRTLGLMWTSGRCFRPRMRRRSKPSTQTYVYNILNGLWKAISADVRICDICIIRV